MIYSKYTPRLYLRHSAQWSCLLTASHNMMRVISVFVTQCVSKTANKEGELSSCARTHRHTLIIIFQRLFRRLRLSSTERASEQNSMWTAEIVIPVHPHASRLWILTKPREILRWSAGRKFRFCFHRNCVSRERERVSIIHLLADVTLTVWRYVLI